MSNLTIKPGFYPFGIRIKNKPYDKVEILDGTYYCPFSRHLLHLRGDTNIEDLVFGALIEAFVWKKYCWEWAVFMFGDVFRKSIFDSEIKYQGNIWIKHEQESEGEK